MAGIQTHNLDLILPVWMLNQITAYDWIELINIQDKYNIFLKDPYQTNQNHAHVYHYQSNKKQVSIKPWTSI